MRIELRAARLTLLARSTLAGLARHANPDDRRSVADAKAGGELPSGYA
jgi:hypothetical protein